MLWLLHELFEAVSKHKLPAPHQIPSTRHFVTAASSALQGFNPLKIVFPGHIRRLQKDSDAQLSSPGTDVTDEAAHAAVDAAAPNTSASSPAQPPEGAASASAAAGSPAAQSAVPMYEQSRIDKFTKLLSSPMIDLNALQEVRKRRCGRCPGAVWLQKQQHKCNLTGCPLCASSYSVLHTTLALRLRCDLRLYTRNATVHKVARHMQAAWTGVPHQHRPRCWRLLLRYEPPSRGRAGAALQRKRREYQDLAPAYYDVDSRSRGDDDAADLKQVRASAVYVEGT